MTQPTTKKPMGRSKSSKSLLILSDLHVGSKYSLCSEQPELDDGSAYNPSYNQKKLKQAWNQTLDEVIQRPNALIINGEPVDGSNPKSMGDSVWSTSFDDQLNDAEKLLNEISYDSLYFVRGSGYHVTREATNFEKILAKQMGAVKYRSVMGNYTYSDFEATFKIFGKHIHFTHHVGYAGWWQYRTTPIARELVKMHFDHEKNGFHTDVLIRSHVHYYVEVRFPNTKGLSTPAWKFPDGFLYRRGEPEMPTVGNIEVIVEPNGKIEIEPHIIGMKFPKPVIDLDKK